MDRFRTDEERTGISSFEAARSVPPLISGLHQIGILTRVFHDKVSTDLQQVWSKGFH